MTDTAWRISGTYLEVCDSDPICPCRRIDGVAGGRSTYGTCTGALSGGSPRGRSADSTWHRCASCWWSGTATTSPARHGHGGCDVDERASDEQRAVLADVFAGGLGGTPLSQFPWAFKPSNRLAAVPSRIEIDHTPGRGWFRAGGAVEVRIRGPFETQSPVSCIIPGHDRSGREVVSELLDAHDGHFEFRYAGRCGYEATFDYTG